MRLGCPAILLILLLGGCLRPAIEADAPLRGHPQPAPDAGLAQGSPVRQEEWLDPADLPLRPLSRPGSARRVGAAPPPRPAPAGSVPALPGAAAALGGESPPERTMEDRRPPRQPFLRPALGESLPATAPPVAEELPLLDPPPRQPSLDEVLPGREDPPETAWLESPEDAWAAEEELLAPATPARPVVPPDARFQIQIMSTSDPETAEDMRLQAELVFAGAAVEVVWDPPNYKVRVGGVATMEEAGELKRQALRLGFNNAWVVPRRQP